jgi:hypothetical protein
MSEMLTPIFKRRDFLCSHPPRCPECNTDQVQIRRFDAPALWRCQMCEHWFEHEPDDRGQNEKSYTVVYKHDRWIAEVEEPWRCGPTKKYFVAYGVEQRAKLEKLGRLDWKRILDMVREMDADR